MDIPTIPGAWYTVATSTTCEITDTATGTPLGSANAGSYTFQAQGNLTTLSDDSALYSKSNFKSAPAALMALGLLGGGASTPALPPGYLAAAFLETESSAEIKLPLVFDVNIDSGLTIEQSHQSVAAQVSSSAGWAEEGYGGINIGMLNGSMACSRNGMGVGTSFIVPANEWFIHKWWFDGKSADIICYAPDGRSYKTSRTRSGCTAYTLWANRWKGKKRWFRALLADVAVFDLIPAITPQGAPCMFNKYDNAFYENTAGKTAFVVGLTLAQARNLSKLPATGGTLTISLPTGYDSDSGVMSALESARANGWTLTIQTYTPEASASVATFALRRIWVRRTADENGSYVATDGTRWQVDWCVDMLTPDGSTPDAYGYELFRSQEAAVAYWELTPYVDPEAENLLTE